MLTEFDVAPRLLEQQSTRKNRQHLLS